jgi:tRNA U34 5-carboxymethylaminomethyl modifying enzyme MnmG/GidA
MAAASAGVEAALAIADAAATTAAEAAVEYYSALKWVATVGGVGKVLLCAALEVGLGSVIDKFAGEGAS